MKIFIVLLLFVVNLFALSISSNDRYNIFENEKYQIIFTPQYEKEAIFIKENLDEFLALNNSSFGYTFDEPLKIVLISDNIELANAFSTQIPFNMNALYNGGSSKRDYFSTTSWLSAVLTHELIHNYQLNAKKSEISKTLHKYLGNNYMPIFAGFLPLWTLPNLMLPTAILEGNAVLNESIYGNGGRLYSGRMLALANNLILNNKITPLTLLNDTLEFPYTESKYIIGGFYMKYLATKYGIDTVNSFFFNNSIHSINPFLLNQTFYKTFGISYEKSVVEFVSFHKHHNKDFSILSQGKTLATSQSEIYLSKIDNNISFLTTNLKTRAILNSFDTKSQKFSSLQTTLKNGELFKINEKLYTSSDGFITSTLYKHGLFDENSEILGTTTGKSIQDINDGKIAYFHIKESFDKPALYIDDKFIDFVDSSALFDEIGNIYYFKQNKTKRTLFKNQTPLLDFDGYYSKIVDIKKDAIYFVSNSKVGSGLYKLENERLFQLTTADNILSGKILDENKMIVTTLNRDGYKAILVENFVTTPIKELPNTKQIQYQTGFEFSQPKTNLSLESSRYNELKELSFSLLYPYYTYDSQKGDTYQLQAFFSDPIMFNTLSVEIIKTYDEKLAGFNYTNERYIPFELSYYDIDSDVKTPKERGHFAKAKLFGPLFRNDGKRVDGAIELYQDEDNKQKEPTLLSLKYTYDEQYPLASNSYLSYNGEIIARKDRDANTKGLKGNFSSHLFGETYFNLNGKWIVNSKYLPSDAKGVEIVDTIFDEAKDSTNVLMEGIDNNFYAKNLSSSGIGASSTFYLNKYFSVFPISLRKEELFGSWNRYNIETLKKFTIDEKIVGAKFDLLFFHKLPLPVTVKYIKNDASVNDYKVAISIGTEF
jgi:hypothetical protein